MTSRMMTYDFFSTLYRRCLGGQASSTAADQPDPAQRPALVAIRDALGKGDVLPAEQHFQALLALPAAALERTVCNDSLTLLSELERWHGKETLSLLHEWALQCPMSIWPRLLELAYWCGRLIGLRLEYAQKEQPLPSEPWNTLSIANHVIYLQAMALLGQSELDWHIAQLLLSVELITGPPEWVEAWCGGVGSVTLPDRNHLLDTATLELEQVGIDNAWWPALPPERPALLQYKASDLQSMAPQLNSRWLRIGLHASPYGYCCLHQMAASRFDWLPEAPAALHKTLIALARSQGLSNDDINALDSLFWQEDVDVLMRSGASPRDIQTRITDYLHHRPLSPQARTNFICLLIDHWENVASASRYSGVRQWRLWQRDRSVIALMSQPAETINDHWLTRLVRLWVRHGKENVGCRPLIESLRHHNPLAAVLYGVMCDNGWAGLKRDARTATAWYRYAVELSPPDGVYDFSETNSLHEPFSQALLLLTEQDGQDSALWNMLCFAADAGYSDAQYRRGLFMSIKPASCLVDDAEKWLLASLREDRLDTFVAYYHLSILYAGRIRDVTLDDLSTRSETPFSERAMYYFMAFLQQFLDDSNSRHAMRDEDYGQIEHAMLHAVEMLCVSPELHSLYLQPLHRILMRYRDELRLTVGFIMLAYLYGHKHSPMPHFDMAVRMIEGLRQMFPTAENIQFMHDTLRQQSDTLQRRFDQIAATVPSGDLPGCSTITSPTPTNPFE